MLSWHISLETVIQAELDNARVDAGGTDLSQRPAPYSGTLIFELKVIIAIDAHII
jgi:hypothetical protein